MLAVADSAIPTASTTPPAQLYRLDPRATALLAAVEPLREWRRQSVTGNSPPPDLKEIAALIDALAVGVHRYVGERLEPFPLPS